MTKKGQVQAWTMSTVTVREILAKSTSEAPVLKMVMTEHQMRSLGC